MDETSDIEGSQASQSKWRPPPIENEDTAEEQFVSKKPTKAPLIILAGIVLVSIAVGNRQTLSNGRPSESEARAALDQKIRNQSRGLIRLASFQKTNGMEQNFGGMRAYQMDYTADIEFVNDCMWSGGNSLEGWSGDFVAQSGQQSGGLDGFLSLSQGMQQARRGQHQRISGQFHFVKTEQGWRLSD